MSGQPNPDSEALLPNADPEGWQLEQRALRDQAERCRRLARSLYTRENSLALEQMAERFEQSAHELDTRRTPQAD